MGTGRGLEIWVPGGDGTWVEVVGGVVDPGGDGPWLATTGAGASLDSPRRAGIRKGNLLSPPPVDGAVKSKSLPVQGHDP